MCLLSNLMLCKMFNFRKSLKTMQKSLELLTFLIRDILLHLIKQYNVTGKSCLNMEETLTTRLYYFGFNVSSDESQPGPTNK